MDQCEVITRTDCLNNSLPIGKRICAQLPEAILLQKLKGIGGYNPRFVAMTKEDAAKFKDPRLFFKIQQQSSKYPTRSPGCNHHSSTTSKPQITRPTHQPPKPTRPTRPTTKPWYKKPRQKRPRPQDQPSSDQDKHQMDQMEMQPEDMKPEFPLREQKLIRSKRQTSAISGCWQRGAAVTGSNDQRYHLCGECHLITTLNYDVRPRLINEAGCKHTVSPDPNQAQDGNSCAWNSGLCQQRVLLFPALKFRAYERHEGLSIQLNRDIYVEKWDEFTQQIRAGCQCEIHQSRAAALAKLQNLG
ncbi:hypothetical protein QZH41_000942 [Actinostola sp. cb2023]|nr:hypothetical protein QZH41_000942 [Actinostola sp. cb2023]